MAQESAEHRREVSDDAVRIVDQLVARSIVPAELREVAEFEISMRVRQVVMNKMAQFSHRMVAAAEAGQAVAQARHYANKVDGAN